MKAGIVLFAVVLASPVAAQTQSDVLVMSAKQVQSIYGIADYKDDPGLAGITLFNSDVDGASVIRRTVPTEAELHTRAIDMWYVLSGKAILVTGGSLIEPKEVAGGNFFGRGVSGGGERQISEGEVVRIPVGVAHWVRKIEGKELVYLNFKSRPSAASPAGHGISAPGSGPASLAGRMAMYNPLLGSPWTCATQLSTSDAQPQQQTSTVSFSATSQNVLHIEVSSPQFAAHSFIGFDSKSNQYWRTEMGVFGGIMRETSADGTNFSGKSTMGETWEPVRSVLTTVEADGSSSDTEWWTRNGIELTFTSRCMR